MPQAIDYVPTSHAVQRVSVRESWADDWLPVLYLWADVVEFAASPALPTAEFVWSYGRGARQGETAVSVVVPSDLVGWYVRVELTGGPTWYGVIAEQVDNRDGSVDIAGVRVPTGQQRLIAYGLEYLLGRGQVAQSVVEGTAGDVTVDRTIAFNAGDGRGSMSGATGANCSTTTGDSGVRVFAGQLSESTATEWFGGFVVAYLLEFFAPRNKSGSPVVPMILELGDAASALNYAVPTIDPTGRTVRSILNEIANRRRGLAWQLVFAVDDAGDEFFKVRIHTFARSKITLSGGVEIPPNIEQVDIMVDTSADVIDFEVRESDVDRFDQIITRGARRGAVVSLSAADGTLAADWTASLESDYEAAATTAAGYAGWSAAEKVAHHDDARAADRFERVWSWFVLPDNWDGEVGDGIGGTKYKAFPTLDANGNITTTGESFWRPGLRIERTTPLLVGHDYSGANVPNDTVTSTDPSTAQPEFVPPFVLLPTRVGEWQYAERFNAADQSGDTERAQTWAANVDIRADDAGVILSVVGGKQHYLGDADFNANADDDTDVFDANAVDWQGMIATVYVLQDSHIESRYPADGDVADSDAVRRLVIHVPDAHLDYIPPGTVVRRHIEGSLDRVTSGGFIRDDRDRLEAIARSAWEWYGTPRKKLTASIRGIRTDATVGQMIRHAGIGAARYADINAVVTSVRYDLLQNTTTIRTDHAELDQGLLS